MTETGLRTRIHIIAHNVMLSQPVCEFVRAKIGSLARIASDILLAEVVLRRDPGAGIERFAISVRLALPGRDIHGRASASDLYAAVGIATARLARRLRKRKTRLSKSYHLVPSPRDSRSLVGPDSQSPSRLGDHAIDQTEQSSSQNL